MFAETAKLWIGQNLTLFRVMLGLCCLGYWVIMVKWLKPDKQAFRKGILAAGAQFWLGLLVDMVCVRVGSWVYHDLPFSVAGVPIDLHLDWSLLWGCGLVWLADRWPGANATGKQIWAYISLWTALTVAFDVMVAEWMIFLADFQWYWWIVDLLFLFVVQGVTLWIYWSIGMKKGSYSSLACLRVIPPYTRAVIYLSFFIPLFFLYLPSSLLDLASYFGLSQGVQGWLAGAAAVAFVATSMGGWAVYEFATKGEGTPIPWDPPHHLVRTGPYAFVSNPMQLSGVLMSIALVIWKPSWVLATYSLNMIITSALLFSEIEHVRLQEKFGQAFRGYRTIQASWRVRWLPRVPIEQRPVVLFDDECGLCLRLVRFLVAADLGKVLRVAPLNGKVADAVFQRFGHCRLEDSLYLWEPGSKDEHRGSLALRGEAVIRTLGYMPLPLSLNAAWLGVPGVKWITNSLYRFIATSRKKVCRFHPENHRMIVSSGQYLG